MGGGMRRQETGRGFHIVVEQNDEIARGGPDPGIARPGPATVGSLQRRHCVGSRENSECLVRSVGRAVNSSNDLEFGRRECLGSQRGQRAQQRVPALIRRNDYAELRSPRHEREPIRKRFVTLSSAPFRFSRTAEPVRNRETKSKMESCPYTLTRRSASKSSSAGQSPGRVEHAVTYPASAASTWTLRS